MGQQIDSERELVDVCLELARERYDGPVRINVGRCSDGMWTVDMVQDRALGSGYVYSDRSSSRSTMEMKLLARRGAARLEALEALRDSLQRMPTKLD
jgi:hypothetical protein